MKNQKIDLRCHLAQFMVKKDLGKYILNLRLDRHQSYEIIMTLGQYDALEATFHDFWCETEHGQSQSQVFGDDDRIKYEKTGGSCDVIPY